MAAPPTNLLVDASFESGAGAWEYSGGAVRISSAAYTGSFAAEIPVTAAYVRQAITVTTAANRRYHFSARARWKPGVAKAGELQLGVQRPDNSLLALLTLSSTGVATYYRDGGSIVASIDPLTYDEDAWSLLTHSFVGGGVTSPYLIALAASSSAWQIDDMWFGTDPVPQYIRHPHPPGRGRLYVDEKLGSFHREFDVHRDRYELLRRNDDRDDLGRDDYEDYPIPVEEERPEP